MSEMSRSTQDVEERQQYMLFNVIQLSEGPFVNTSNINESSMINRSVNSHNESCLSVNQPHHARHNECVNCPTNTTGQIITSNERSNEYDANKYHTTTISSAATRYNKYNNSNSNNINSQQYCVNAPNCNQGKRKSNSATVIRMQHPYQQLHTSSSSSPSQQEEYHEHQVYAQNLSQPNVPCQHTVTHANKNCVNYIMETSTTPCNYSSPAITPTTAVTTSSPAVRDVLYTQSCAAPLMVKRETNGSMIGPFMNSFQPPVALYTNAISSSSSPSYSSPITSQKEEQITPSSYLSPRTNLSLQWPNSGQNDTKKQQDQMQREGSINNNTTIIMNTNNSNNDDNATNENITNVNCDNNDNKSNPAVKVLQMAHFPSFTMMQENTDEPLYEVLPYSCDILLEHNIDSLDQVQCILHGKKRSAQNMMLARNKKTNEIIWWCRNTSRCKVRACEQQKNSLNSNQSGKVMVEVVRCDQPHQMRFIANQLHSPSHLNTFHRYSTQTSEANNTHVSSRDEQTHGGDGSSGTNIMENTQITSYHLEPVTPPVENAIDKSRTRYDGYYLTPYTNVKLVAPINVAPSTLLYQQIQNQNQNQQPQHQNQNQNQQQQQQQQQINWNAKSFDLHQQGVNLPNTIAVISPPQQPSPAMLTSQKYQHEPYRQVMMLPNNSRDYSQLTGLPENNSQCYSQNNMMCNKESVGNDMNYVQHPYHPYHIQQQEQEQQFQQFKQQKRNMRTTPTPVQVIRGNALPLYIPFGAEVKSECTERYNLHSQQQQLHEHQLSQLPPPQQQYQQLYQSTSIAQAPYAPHMQYNQQQEIALPKTDNDRNAE